MIYKSAKGEGFNPLMHVNVWLSAPIKLNTVSAKSRVIAYLNFSISTFLILVISLWVSGIMPINTLLIALSAAGWVAWRMVSLFVIGQDQILTEVLPEPVEFRASVFTAEWFAFYFFLAFYLMSAQTLTAHKFTHITLSVLAGISVCLMLIPAAQGSLHALRTRQ